MEPVVFEKVKMVSGKYMHCGEDVGYVYMGMGEERGFLVLWGQVVTVLHYCIACWFSLLFFPIVAA